MIWPSPYYYRLQEDAMSNSTMKNYNTSAQKWGNVHNRWPQTSPEQSHHYSQDATPWLQKIGTIICWHDKLLIKILTQTNRTG